VYRQSTRYSCFTEESWASVGLEFGVQWVGVFTATRQSVNHNQKPDVYFINGHVKIWVRLLHCWCLHFTQVCDGWVGLGPCVSIVGWVKKNGPTSISAPDPLAEYKGAATRQGARFTAGRPL